MRMIRFWASFSLFFVGCLTSLTIIAPAQEKAGDSNAADSARIAKWQASAQKGEPWACFNVGLSYHLGRFGIPRDPTEAAKWYRAAAERGYALAQANLGYCYDTGFGVEAEPIEAVKWYQMAALQGNAFAQFNVGKKYHSGPGVGLDQKLALRWLSQAAQQSFVPAYFTLGQMHANDSLGNPDYKEAMKWFRLAADQGYAAAQHAIGYINHAGLGMPTNYFEAVKWYNAAASRNFPDSHYNLAICYERGLGVPQNLITAVNHYRTAAELGHANAQYSLGVCYYEGKGLEVDFVQAYKWWNLAAVQGIPEASTSREILSRLMAEKQIKEGQRLASEFKARPTSTTEAPKFIQAASTDVSEIRRIGTGFLITTNGYVLTTFQTVSGGNSFQVITEGGNLNAEVVKSDALNNIALLKVEGQFYPLRLTTSRDTAAPSDFMAVGFEGRQQIEFNPKVAQGKVSAVLGFQADPRQFSLEPRITSSFGGAGIINKHGQTIGMMVTNPEEIASEPNQKPANANSYAIKSDHLVGFLRLVPDVKVVLEEPRSGQALPAEELLSRSRAATVLIVVL
jgi:TPR repeat protein